MLARDVMISDIPIVTPDADVGLVARLLLERGIGAVPVVNETLSPIGIVTRGVLAGPPAPDGVDLGEIPEFLLHGRARPAPRFGARDLRELMSAPAIFAPDTASISDIARVMAERRIGYLPIVRNGRLVGLVNRERMRCAMADAAPKGARPSEPATAAEFRKLVAAHEIGEKRARAESRQLALEEREMRLRALAARRLTDAQWREMLNSARAAAAAGMNEWRLIRFPSALCRDGGRAINAPDPQWPLTLRGEPADVYRRWREELYPQGFRLAAQIVEFPDGVPGDAAMYLIWDG